MIFFTGDLYLGNNIEIDSELKSKLSASECIITNFENVLEGDNRDFRKDKSSCLTYDSHTLQNYLESLKTSHLFSLANNHIHDLGPGGVENTYNNLQLFSNSSAFGISRLGGTYKIIDCKNKLKIGVITGSTCHPEVMSIIEDADGNKMNNIYSHDFTDIVLKVKRQVDFLVVYVHWGQEYLHYPRTDLRLLSYEWIDNGVDLVLGHHPHVLQGIEDYKGKKILYSLGNYIFPGFYYKSNFKHEWSTENNRSIIVGVDPQKSFEISFIGTIYDQKKHCLNLSYESLNLFEKYSYPLSNLTLKQYHIFFENKYYLFLRGKNNLCSKMGALFQYHKRYGRAGVIINKLIKIYR